ncbi:MAG: hypothetical protein IKJ17_04560 [Clostridia bacterium]|nr:hypothetical protein [Clostridia bacterium]
MKKTELIYENDSYCAEFEATVLSCIENDGRYDVVLDRTAFFPEGGGQAADKGTIDGILVLDVQVNDGVVIHTVESVCPIGKKVTGKIDWQTRFTRMQRHSGEHILSGTVHSLFGYNNVGFHMSETGMKIDFDGPLTQPDIDRVEKEVNFAVWKNLKVTAFYPTDEEIKNIEYRSKLDNIENLRLVEIEGVDCCACCAPHVARTGEVGLVKIIDSMPVKGGIRLTVLAGYEALCDYSMLNTLNKQLMKTLSVTREAVSNAAKRQTELIDTLRHEKGELSNRLAWRELSVVKVNNSAYAFSENSSYDELIYCANKLADEGVETSLLFSKNDDDGYIYLISSRERDVREIVKRLNTTFNGRGGGKPNYAQGRVVCDSTEKLKSFAENCLNE